MGGAASSETTRNQPGALRAGLQGEETMRYLKAMMLAAIAAAAFMIVGAGTASAETTLCKVTESPCSEANMYPIGTEIDASLEKGTKAVLDPSGFFSEPIECEESTVKGQTETTTTPEGKISSLTFAKCDHVVKVMKPGKLKIHWDVEHNGTLTAEGVEVTAEEFGLSCIFGGTVTSGITVTGGTMATVHASTTEAEGSPMTAVVQGLSSFPCPGSAVWTAKYTVNTPEPLYVSKGV